MGDEREIDLVETAIGESKEHFVMEPSGPDEPIGTCTAPMYIGCGHDEIGFRFDTKKKMAEMRMHRLIWT